MSEHYDQFEEEEHYSYDHQRREVILNVAGRRKTQRSQADAHMYGLYTC